MAKLKTYTLGSHGFIDAATRDALGLASHIRQAGVIVVATTKTEAIHILAERGFRRVSPSDSEFRMATGRDLDALAEAGVFDKPGVWVTPMLTRSGDRVVAMQPGGVPAVIGRFEDAGRYRYRFVPEEA